MPTIPQATGSTVRRAPLPTPLANPGMASPDAFGASVADGLQRGGDSVYRAEMENARVKKEAEDDRDRTDAQNAHNIFIEAENKRNVDYRNRTGENAKELTKQAQEEFKKSQEEIESTLTSEGAKKRFRMATDTRWSTQSSAMLEDHQRTQLDAYESQTMEGSALLARQDALNGMTSIEASLAKQQMTRNYIAHKKGEAAELTALQHQADADATIGDFITQQTKLGDPIGAQKAFDQHKDKLSPNLRAVIEEDLNQAKVSVKAQTYAAAIMQDPNQSKALAYQQLKQIDNPELRERTRINVEREFAQREEVKREVQGNTYEETFDAIDAGQSYDEIVAKNPGLIGLLTENQTAALRQAEQNTINRKEPEEWGPEYTEARNTSSYFPDDFAKMNLRLLKGRVRKSEYDDLNERQQAVRALQAKSDGAGSDTAKGFITIDQQVKAALRSIDIDPSEMSRGADRTAAQASADRFTMLMDKKVRAAGGASKVTPEMVKEFSDELLIEREYVVPAGFAGRAVNYMTAGLSGFAGIGVDGKTTVREFTLPAYDNAAFSFDQMSATQRKVAAEALWKAGVFNPTPDEIIEWHTSTLYKNAKAP